MTLAAPGVSVPQRVLFNGVTGTGKTTAAARLAAALKLPFHAVDEEIGWLPASEHPWTQPPLQEMKALARELAARDAWVLDSTYGAFAAEILERTQLVIALDYPRWVSLWRLIRRSLHRAATKTPLCNGNTESWQKLFSRDSIIVWHFRSFRRKHDRSMAWANDPQAPPVLIFTRARDFEKWLRDQETSRTHP